MRVGLDYRPALLGGSGIGRYARELCRAVALLEGAPEMELLGHSWKRARFSENELGLGKTQRLHRRRIPSRAMRWAHRLAGLTTESWIGKIDLFHFTDFVYPPLRPQTPFVATIHDTAFLEEGFFPEKTASALRERASWAAANARVLLTPSAFAAGELAIRLGAKPGKIVVTPLGAGHLPVRPPSPQPPAPFLLTVGTIEPRKNHLRILEAVETLHRRGFPHRWILAGEKGWMTEDFFDRLRVSPSRDRVEIRSGIDDETLARLYADAAALVYPSLYEGFGLPLAEAMHGGAPVVTSSVSSMPEVCTDAAVFVDPRDSASITEGILRVIEDRALADRLREAGRRRAEQLRWETTARGTLQAYSLALRGGERPLARLF